VTIEAGQQLSHYRLIKKIGEGGMGVVWKAEDTRLHRHVALKFVPEAGTRNTDAVDRHLREARAASALNHPNICAIHDIGEWEGRRFIVMELLEGRGLDEQISSGPLDVDNAIELAIQIADALDTAHGKGIVHRDIKPANIFVTDRGPCKVLDFGLAKLTTDAEGKPGPDDATRTSLDATTPGSVMGTVSYMSPEQALGKPLDARTDVFSLGVVLYEMITGRRAFAGTTSAAVFDAILNRAPTAPVELNDKVPAELERIVNKALEKAPAFRYQSAAGVVADLRRLRRDSTTSAPAAPATGRLASRRAPLAFGTVAVLLLIVAGVWWVRDRDKTGSEASAPQTPSVVTGLRIAVLPFATDDPEQSYFGEGLTGEIITELSRYDELAVMPCRSGPCEPDGADAREIGREIGVRYVLQGTVQSTPERIRVTVHLADGRDGRSVWGHTFDSERTAQDLFDLQDELTRQVVIAIAGSHGALARAELPHLRRRPPESLASHDCVFRAYDYLQNSHTAEVHLVARECLERVIRDEPDYVEGLAWLAYLYAEEFHHRWNEPEGEYDSRVRAVRMGERAVALDDANQLAHGLLGVAAVFSGNRERGIAEMQRAVALNPSGNPTVLALLAYYLAFQGDLETSVPIARRLEELVPSPPGHQDAPLMVSHFVHGRYEQALIRAQERNSGPGQLIDPVFLAATLGQLGRIDEASAALDELRELWGMLCAQIGCDGLDIDMLRQELVERWAVAEPLADKLIEGLRKAGLQEARRVTLAVLPFGNIGDDPDQEYFAEGMTDEMITVLGSVNPERLGVIARTSSRRLKDSEATVREIREQLGVSHVVEGSVRRQGNEVRISATLIDAADETAVWTESFNGTLDNIFELQSDVAGRVADALAVTLLPGTDPAERKYVPTPRAYEAYLAGRFEAHKETEFGFKRAIAHYERAVTIDPDYALAHATLSQVCSILASWTTVEPQARLRRAKDAMERAFEIDPDLPEAHVARAYYLLLGEWRWNEVDDAFRTALAKKPIDPGMAYHWWGHYLTFAGRDTDAIAAFDSALRMDPLSALHAGCLGSAQVAADRIDAAERSFERALQLNTNNPVVHTWLGRLREKQGRLDDAVAEWVTGARLAGGTGAFSAPLGYGYGRIGETEKAREVLEGLKAGRNSTEGYVAEINLAQVHAGLGETDEAFEMLEIAVRKREPWILALRVGPGFDTIRNDPRFADLLRRIGVEP
jgi:TolB-like protein/Flp pilus assembly protein TadD